MAAPRLVFEDEVVERDGARGEWLYRRGGRLIVARPTRTRAIVEGREFFRKYGTPERAAETRLSARASRRRGPHRCARQRRRGLARLRFVAGEEGQRRAQDAPRSDEWA